MKTVSNKAKIVKAIIAAAGSKFVSVRFTKKDGQERLCQFNARRDLVNPNASERGKKAAATRKANNPDLINFIDQTLRSSGMPEIACMRSFDCNRVLEIKVNGVVVPLQ